MTLFLTTRLRTVAFAAMLLPFILTGILPESSAQKPPPPVPPNPQAPAITMPMPLGMQRGTTLDLVLTGSNLAGPTGLMIGCPSAVTIPAGDNNGQDNSKLKVRIEVPADAPLGFYPLRLATTRGMSNARLFCIDDLPQLMKADGNRTFEAAHPVPVPCVVVGRTEAERGDYYKISVQPGQRVSFDVLGRRLGSPIDPQLSIYSAKSKRELAHDNDSPGCQTDPRLTYVFKEAGDYIIEIKDVLNRGGADFVYRLRIGDFPLVTTPIPMAAKRGTLSKVHFAGPHADGTLPVDVAVPADPTVNVLWVTPRGTSGLSGWPVALAITDVDEQVEHEPNNEPAQANRVPVPGGVTGRFQHSDDTDYYVFAAKKAQKILIEARTLDLYSPTLVYMAVKNAKTKAVLAKNNPESQPPADQRIEFTAGDDGDYLLELQHLNYVGGPSESYHIAITPSLPGFDVSLGLDRYDVAPDSFVPVTLQVNRRGYTGPIAVGVYGPGPLIGYTAIKAGQNTGTLLVRAPDDAPLGGYATTMVARAMIDGKPITQFVSVKGPVMASLSGLPYPPPQLQNQVAFAVKEKAPFTLALEMEPPEAVPGIATQLVVRAKRAQGFDEAIILNPPAGLPTNVPAIKPVNIAKDKTEAKFTLDVNAKTPLGEYQVLLSGKAKAKDKEYSAYALPLPLVVGQPFELKVEPAVLDLQADGHAKVKISARRKGGYKGPIALEIRKLPAKVTATKGTLAIDQAALELEITATPDAALGEKKDVDVSGTASTLNNLQNASPPFTVRITARAEDPPNYPPPAQVKAAFLKLLDRPRVDADVKSDGPRKLDDGFVREHLTFASEKKPDGAIERVPMLILAPEGAKGRLPAVLVLHGTGGSANGMVPVMKELAKRGIIGVAIDARYHGERSGGAKGAKAYNEAITRAWQTAPGAAMEHPFYYDTCWDIWRALDVLSAREDIDAKRLGMIGFSMGGIETWLAAAVDDRVRAAVPAIGVQSFRYSLEHDEWQGRANTIKEPHAVAARDLGEPMVNQRVCRALWNKVIPGILEEFDCPSMLRLFAGRALLILNGTKDPNCPYGGAKIAIAAAERAFHEAKTPEKLRVMVAPVGHTVTAEQRGAALQWFERWLK
jgi:dienelactone hydrolase